MAGVRKQARKDGTFQGWYKDSDGIRVFFRGTTDRKQTLQIATRLEDDHQQIALGYRPKPKVSDTRRRMVEVVEEYLAWGNTQGGRGGRPWSGKHAVERRRKLAWWTARLNLGFLVDLDGSLSRVERVLRELRQEHAGKTVGNYSENLTAFSKWCVDREYLEVDPLAKLQQFDCSPVAERRALTVNEIGRLLESCRPQFRLLYETAILSGLRAGELYHLTAQHISDVPPGLQLEASWTKNRKKGFQPLPSYLVERLMAYANSGEGLRQYKAAGHRRRKSSKSPLPDSPLLYVPSHTARELDVDLELAGIPKWTEKGKVDFHALRTSFCTLVDGLHATNKETGELARHQSTKLTQERYVRARSERLQHLAESLGEIINDTTTFCVPDVPDGSDSTDKHSCKPMGRIGLSEDSKLTRDAGSIPAASTI